MAAMERKVRDLCAEFLAGKWHENSASIEVTQLTSGTANRTFRCSLTSAADPQKVIVKIYGSETAGEQSAFKFNGEAGEAIITYMLSSMSLGPKLFGVFGGGRIEEFVEGSNPTKDEMKEAVILSGVASRMVTFHTLSMPVSKQVVYGEKMIQSFDGINLDRKIEEFTENDRPHVKALFDFPLIEEYRWYEEMASRLQSPVVFCHNDVQQYNIMLKHSYSSPEDRVMLIDYELSGYNYRGFDIGYFLRSICHQFSSVDGKHSFKEEEEDDQQVVNCFLNCYLKQVKQTANYDPKTDTYDHLYMEFLFFKLPISLGFLGFMRRAANTSVSDAFESLTFITDCIANYRRQKEYVQQKYPHIFNER